MYTMEEDSQAKNRSHPLGFLETGKWHLYTEVVALSLHGGYKGNRKVIMPLKVTL